MKKTRERIINEALEQELNEQFPKGDIARGRALVLIARAHLELDKKEKETKAKFEKIVDEWIKKQHKDDDKVYVGIDEEDMKELKQKIKGR
jgi:ribosomal 50S subunit-associated protein YjgA (DUF615 family)